MGKTNHRKLINPTSMGQKCILRRKLYYLAITRFLLEATTLGMKRTGAVGSLEIINVSGLGSKIKKVTREGQHLHP